MWTSQSGHLMKGWRGQFRPLAEEEGSITWSPHYTFMCCCLFQLGSNQQR